jgi:hypothetical protein
MWEVMNCCVIMHNMIIGIAREEQVHDDHPFDHQGPLAQLDQLHGKFSALLAMHQEIQDGLVHT